jgi:hypothetical protein
MDLKPYCATRTTDWKAQLLQAMSSIKGTNCNSPANLLVSGLREWKQDLPTDSTDRHLETLVAILDAIHHFSQPETLQALLELAYWESLELVPTHSRRQVVLNMLCEWGTWEGYFRLSWRYIAVCGVSQWVDVGFGTGEVARKANLEMQRRYVLKLLEFERG